MVVVWLPLAKKRAKEIHSFYKNKSKLAADKLVMDIKQATIPLAEFPQMGALEQNLSDLQISFRSLVVRDNYKIVYFIEEEKNTVNIATVWDCRQDDKKLKNELF